MRYLLLLSVLTFAVHVQAQQPGCGTDQLNALLATPERTAAMAQLEQHLLQTNAEELRGMGFTVPIVFHVISENNGPENLPDDVLLAGVDALNLRFQNAGAYVDDSLGHVVPIAFCIASIDPFGQPTTGITRHESALTVNSMNDELAVKSIARWDPYRYLNIWVVRTITDPNVGGYASFPWDLGSAHDGIVAEAIGIPGGYLLAHEAGHYLGLYHTFQGGCQNANCQLDGDRVCDTPPDATNNWQCGGLGCDSEVQDTTGLDPFTTDVPELPNYMDYSGCTLFSFSQGQADRMAGFMATVRTALNASYACGSNTYGPPPVATVLVDSSACTGRITFTNTTPGADFVQWDGDLTNAAWDAIGNSYSVDYPYTGDYSMLMAACTPQGTDTVRINLHVRVAPTPYYPIASGYQGLPFDPWEQQLTACPGQVLTFTGVPGMASYTWSTGSTNDSITWQATQPFSVHLTAVDADGLAWTNCALEHINVHQPTLLVSDVADTVTCGTPVTLNLGIPIYPSSYMWYHNGQGFGGPIFTYSTTLWELGWQDFAVRLIDNVGCSVWSNTVSIHVAPSVPPVITQVGNDLVLDHGLSNFAWYHDGVPIPNQNQLTWPNATPGCYWIYGYDCSAVYSDTLCLIAAGVGDIEAHGASLTPDLTSSTLTLTTAVAEKQTVMLFDAQGRIVRRSTTAGTSTTMDVQDLAPGAYTVVLGDAERTVLRFVRVP